MNLHALGALVEERRDAMGWVGHMLNVDDRNASGSRLRDGPLDRQQDAFGVGQRECPSGKVVVLKIDEDECRFRHVCS